MNVLDTKTNEQILKILIELKDDINYIDLPIPLVSERLPKLSEDNIYESMNYLEFKGLVSITIASGTIYRLKVTPKGIGYFFEKEEARSKERSKKWESRIWDIFKIAIGFGLGYLTYWLKLNK